VEISGNSIGEDILGKSILLEDMEAKDLQLDKEQGLELIRGH
jgi:hypothetical protein